MFDLPQNIIYLSTCEKLAYIRDKLNEEKRSYLNKIKFIDKMINKKFQKN